MMKRAMKTKTAAMLVAVAAVSAACAYEVRIGGDFAESDPSGHPSAWIWHDYPGYLPHAETKVESTDGGNVLHYFAPKGNDGSAIRSRRRIPAVRGDLINVRMEARGTGKAWFTLYCWTAKGGWTRSLTACNVALEDKWKTSSFTFTVVDNDTRLVEVALGLKPGADAWIRNVRVNRKLDVDRILAKDDFENVASRPGAPELVRGDIAPGLLSPTTKGVYRTTRRVDIVPTARCDMPVSGEFLTSGIRLYGFDANGAGRLGTAFTHCGGKFLFKIVPEGGDIVCSFTEGERHVVPATALPADFVFSAATDGTYELAVTSLANSQTTGLSGRSNFFIGATNGVERTVALLSAGGAKAEATVDNVFLAVSRPQRQAKIDYPYTAKPQPEFDPVKAGWPLVFSDEFDGQSVDGEKWDLSRRTAATHAHVENGILRIKTDYEPGSTNKLMTTGLWSMQTFLYGYFEARLKFTTYNGWWAAFWLCSRATGNPFLDGYEIDIFEDYYMRNPARNKLDHNLHVKGGGPLKSWNYNSILPGTHRDWYTIGCKWTPFEITYYLNGKAIPSKASHGPYETVTFDAFRYGTCIMPLHAIISGQIMKVAYGKHDPDPEEVFPEYFDVDYVRVYGYPGSAEGAAPKVSLSSGSANKFTIPVGTPVSFKVSATPAANTGSKIKAVHLFDDGYYLATKREPPYDFIVPLTEDFFSRTSWAAPGRSGVRPEFDGSLHVLCAFAEDEDGVVGHSGTVSFMIAPPGESRPFRGKAAEIPGVVVAGHYDEGGPGVAYCDSTAANTGSSNWRQDDGVDGGEHSVGGVSSGEWIKYTVDVKRTGRYRLKFMYGTPSPFPHTVDVLLDGDKLATLGPFKRHAAEHWGADTLAEAEMTLPAGRHVLMLHLFGQFNFGDFEFVEVK